MTQSSTLHACFSFLSPLPSSYYMLHRRASVLGDAFLERPTLPPFCFIMGRARCCRSANAENRLVLRVASKSASLVACAGFSTIEPAFGVHGQAAAHGHRQSRGTFARLPRTPAAQQPTESQEERMLEVRLPVLPGPARQRD